MFKNILIGILVALSLVVTPLAVRDYLTHTQTQPNFTVIRQATKLVYLEDNMGNGSGVMIAPHRLLTAGHVAAIHHPETPLFVDGKQIKRVIKLDEEADLAILEVDSDCPCVDIGDLPLVDAKIVIIGFPGNSNIHVQILTEGRIQGIDTEHNRVVTNADVSPGNSGGGLYSFINGKWYLVGILVQVAGAPGPYGMPQFITYLSLSVTSKTIKQFIGLK